MSFAALQPLVPDLLGDKETIVRLLAAMPFLVVLSYLAVTDARHLRLPLGANLALSLSGLVAGGLAFGSLLEVRLLGWLAGYLVLHGIALAYRRLRGHDGIGGGDPLLLAGIGAWLGWALLPLIVLLAALTGLVLAAIMLLLTRNRGSWRQVQLPLGSLLAVSSLVLVVSGQGLPPTADGDSATINLPLDGQDQEYISREGSPVLGFMPSLPSLQTRADHHPDRHPTAGG